MMYKDARTANMASPNAGCRNGSFTFAFQLSCLISGFAFKTYLRKKIIT